MFRFTIRDVLWLTVVVALSVGWWRYHLVAVSRYQLLSSKLEKTRESGLAAWHHMLKLERELKGQLSDAALSHAQTASPLP